MNLDTSDWVSFCEGRKSFSKSHFYTLLMKTEYDKGISDKEYHDIFKFFPNTSQLIERLKNYYSNSKKRNVDDVKKTLIELVNKDVKEKSILFKENDIEALLMKPVKYIDDIEIVLNAKLKKWQHEEYIDVIDNYVFDRRLSNETKFYALFEAFYGLTHNFQLVWYLGSPLLDTDVNFDNYYNIWKNGGEYAVTESGVIVSRYK